MKIVDYIELLTKLSNMVRTQEATDISNQLLEEYLKVRDDLSKVTEYNRWHFPDCGELPKMNRDVVYEHGSSVDCGVYGDFGNGELGFYTVSSSKPIKPFFVIRWKYIGRL